MDERYKKILKEMKQEPQTQIALNDQLEIAMRVSNKLGLYDAADFISAKILHIERDTVIVQFEPEHIEHGCYDCYISIRLDKLTDCRCRY